MTVWDGAQWAEGTKWVWDGASWVRASASRFFDGITWQSRAPAPVAYPTYAASATAIRGAVDYVTVAVPPSARVNDFLVSVCTAADVRPQLLSPGGYLTQAHQLDSGHWVSVAMWPHNGIVDTVVWETTGSSTATAMNLAYRGGDLTRTPLAPIVGVQQYNAVNRVPLPAATAHTSLFLVLVESTDLTGYAWPEGVTGRAQQLGIYGARHISLLASDTPGAGSSAGELLLDTQAASAACLTIEVPGRTDGRPTWILGDDNASVLGSTTVLG
ncbi:hypothetical protein [Streptomyces buecherae]|uniref:Uncharacterized protein n=1 Tax=Streptomyces buecherae TaxID=2763006 RepID=A0A7H8N2Y5_9ACTN|nr:hypothetical protein [Streptomyces buecherae]QKW48874.1 hypothetical protein HUT08_04200 [Streptomyces buecherae]